MGFRFVIGRAGSGKTRWCISSIAQELHAHPLGQPIYWVLPRQATFTAERSLACEVNLPGFCRARVVSFDELCSQVLAECGGSAIPEVTQLGRQMILGHLLRKHETELKFFTSVARQASLAQILERTFDELDQCGASLDQLDALRDSLFKDGAASQAVDATVLSDKLHDLRLIYDAYSRYLGQERLDPRRRIEQVLACVSKSAQLRGATIYIDAFLEFTEFERRLLARLGKVAGQVNVTLLLDPSSPVIKSPAHLPHEMSLFHKVERTYTRLLKALQEEGVVPMPPQLLREPRRFTTPAAKHIERHFFSDSAERFDDESASLTLVEAPSRRAEVENAARHIRHLLSNGLRKRDIALLVRNLEPYQDLLAAAFREHNIRFFIDRRRTMAHHPLLRCVRSLIAIAQHRWPHHAVMMLIKSGLGGVSLDQADRLENYVLAHHLRASAWTREKPWIFRKPAGDVETSHQPDESEEMDRLRRSLADKIARFTELFPKPASDRISIRHIATALFAVLSELKTSSTLSRWIETARANQKHEEAGEHEQAWSELVTLFDAMVDLMGDEPVTIEDFRQILEAGLETFDLGLAPPTVDEVLVGTVDRTRTAQAKAVLVLGLDEGTFPHAARDTSLLSDAEREELACRQFELGTGAERKLLDENLLGYLAFTRASEQIYASRPCADDSGRVRNPSPFWTRLVHLFPVVTVRALPRDDREDPSLIATPRQLLTSLMRWARAGADPQAADGAFASLYQWLALHPPGTDGDSLDAARYRAWRALGYDNHASLSPDIARQVFTSPLSTTARQLESFAACPFQHFLRYSLHLESRDEDDRIELSLENAFHQVLNSLVQDMLSRQVQWCDLSPEEAQQWVRSYAHKASMSLRGQTMLSDARNQYLLQRIERTLEEVIAHQQAMARRGSFRTCHTHADYGSDAPGSLPPLQLNGPNVQLRIAGTIDRIDVIDNTGATAVIDWSAYASALQLWRVKHGLSLRLVTNLIAIEDLGPHLADGRELQPAAAFQVTVSRRLGSEEHPDDALDPAEEKFALRVKPRGIFDGQYLPALDNQCSSGPSEVVNAHVKQDGSFGYLKNSDVAETAQFTALRSHVRKVLLHLGQRILSGEIQLRPYKMNTESACARCTFKSVCRFDPTINGYTHVTAEARDQILNALAQEATDQ